MRDSRRDLITSVVALAAAACAPADRRPSAADGARAAAAAPAGVAGTPAQRAAPLTDAGIVALAAHVNNSELLAAQAVAGRLVDPGARAYAAAMLTEHLALNRALHELSVKRDTLSLPPAQFAGMRFESDTALVRLGETPYGRTLDGTYIDHQVAAHRQAADSLARWEQAARDPGLRAALAAAIPRVRGHLARAEATRAVLRGADADSAAAERLSRAGSDGSPPAAGIRRP